MCDFKPGDEVVLYRYMEDGGHPLLPAIGHVGFVNNIGKPTDGGPEFGLTLTNWPVGMNVLMFRKVERRTDKLSLTEWLSQPSGDTDKLDKTRSPAKRRERA